MSQSILIVDDSVSVRQSLHYILTESGFTVAEASDGEEGLRLLLQDKFNLVLTDVNMPNMDGIAMLQRVRENGPNKFTPILVLTTESQSDAVKKGKAAGASGWIVKPFTSDKLIGAVKKVLG